ncbi:MAG: DUF1854 domain-containing protein [Oscillospiraceae bacterium]|nr:DUF1854 domain-containing protein [Oscillospiraceae bacterium]
MEINNNINDIIDIVYLTPENAKFTLSENKFLQLTANVRHPEKKEGENPAEIEKFFFERVFLHRAFPFQNPFEYISVSGNFPKTEEQLKKEQEEKEKKEREEKEEKEKNSGSPAPLPESEKKPEPKESTTSLGELKEIGIISNISVFGETQQKYLAEELGRKYFVPIIEVITNVKEKYGFSYWEVGSDIGKIKFTVHDAYRNILKITDDRIMVTDVNGNRYEITSLDKLDRKSFRRIELFL